MLFCYESREDGNFEPIPQNCSKVTQPPSFVPLVSDVWAGTRPACRLWLGWAEGCPCPSLEGWPNMFLFWLFVQLCSSNHMSAVNPWKLKSNDELSLPKSEHILLQCSLNQQALVIHNPHSNKNISFSLEQQALINPTQNMKQEVIVNPDPYISKKTSSSSVNLPCQTDQEPFPLNFEDSGPIQTKIHQKTFPSSL